MTYKYFFYFFFFKQKTAYELYQCDWSSDVCSSDLEVCSIGLEGNPDGTQRFDLVVVPIAGIGPYTLDIFSQE